MPLNRIVYRIVYDDFRNVINAEIADSADIADLPFQLRQHLRIRFPYSLPVLADIHHVHSP